MTILTATVDAQQFPGATGFLGQVDASALTVTFTVSGQYLWAKNSILWAQPEGGYAATTPPFPEFPPTYDPTAVTDNWELFLPPFEPFAEEQWFCFDASPANSVPLCLMVIAIPHGNAFPYLGSPATQITSAVCRIFRVNRGPTVVNVGAGAGQIPAGYDLWCFANQIGLNSFYASNASGTLTVTAVVMDPATPTPPVLPTPPPPVLAVTQGCLGAQVQMNWLAASGTVQGYRVYRNGAFLMDVGMALTFTDFMVGLGVTYSYYVTAYNSGGESSPSLAETATPCLEAPSGLTWTGCQNTAATLLWNGLGGVAPAVTAYNLYRDGVVITTIQNSLGAGNTVEYTDTSVVVGQTYAYQVSAVGAAGEGQLSFPLTIVACVECEGYTRQAIPVTAYSRQTGCGC